MTRGDCGSVYYGLCPFHRITSAMMRFKIRKAVLEGQMTCESPLRTAVRAATDTREWRPDATPVTDRGPAASCVSKGRYGLGPALADIIGLCIPLPLFIVPPLPFIIPFPDDIMARIC